MKVMGWTPLVELRVHTDKKTHIKMRQLLSEEDHLGNCEDAVHLHVAWHDIQNSYGISSDIYQRLEPED